MSREVERKNKGAYTQEEPVRLKQSCKEGRHGF